MAAIRLGWHLPVARTPGQLEAGGGAGEDRNDR
jgi:hypothetical protein